MSKLHNGVLPYELAVPRPTKAAVEPFGVAATAAHLLKLSAEQTVHAMGHAGQSVMSTYEGTGTQPFGCDHLNWPRLGRLSSRMLAPPGW
jgi:hypothetical protein